MFMVAILWVFGPVGVLLSSHGLSSHRIFAFSIFCELNVPTPEKIVLATQSLVKDVGNLVFA